MNESMKGLGLVADPNNPFYTPPSMSELILRTLGQAVPPPGRLRVPNGVGGQLLGAAIRVGGGLAGNIGDEQLRQRLDPLARQLAINQQAAQAAQGISVPVSPAQNVPVEGPLQESGAFGTAGSERPIGTIPAITRPPISEYELFAHAPNDKARAILTMAGNPGRFINNPLPAEQLKHVQAQNKHLEAQAAAEGMKGINQQVFAEVVKMHAAGVEIPKELGAFLNDDQRAQVSLPTKAILEAQMKDKLGMESSQGSLMQKTYEQAATAQAIKQGLTPNTDEFKIRKAELFAQFLNNPESYPNIAAKTVREDYLKKHPGDVLGANRVGGDEYLRVQGQVANVKAREGATGALEVHKSYDYLSNQANINQWRAEGKTLGTPLDPATRKTVEFLESVNRQAKILNDNYDPSFLGPIKGTEKAYSVRRTIGSYINSPIGQKEERFRGALGIMQENFARAKEGAVIPIEMYNRLTGLVGRPTFEPEVFQSSIGRFTNEVGASIDTTIRLDTTPRGRSRGPSNIPARLPPPPVSSLPPGWEIVQ